MGRARGAALLGALAMSNTALERIRALQEEAERAERLAARELQRPPAKVHIEGLPAPHLYARIKAPAPRVGYPTPAFRPPTPLLARYGGLGAHRGCIGARNRAFQLFFGELLRLPAPYDTAPRTQRRPPGVVVS